VGEQHKKKADQGGMSLYQKKAEGEKNKKKGVFSWKQSEEIRNLREKEGALLLKELTRANRM